ncbi:DUF3592 domain-containing protein [Corallococcus sp. Z5C101001]|uniref:DUF3592 domain-containing protein n=1 Tax=Corallococcus sp. Z5C101001 TaxID=2596829 RepID=UPI0011812E8B|nr:DUF3592 domain-containing protein [Corallococcus sp. Z5C101001]TSC24006.1 hypothetical protein FOF48_27790 [Corallococcus sp. Z5C101001]
MPFTTLIILLVVFAGAPLLLLRLLLKYRGITVRLRQEGVRVRAEVVSVTRYARGRQQHVFHCFALPDGSRMYGNFREAADDGERPPGSTVDIVYLADAPHHNMRPGTGVERRDVIRGTVFLLLFAAVGVLGLLQAWSLTGDTR